MIAQPTTKLEIRNLRKSFGPNLVLNGLNLSLEAGEITVLIGPSGSGKSVLAKCILGLLPVDAGEIVLDGVEMTGLAARKREELLRQFGVLFQRGALFDSLPVWRNVAFALIEGRGIRRAEARAVALEKLAKVGLGTDVADLMPAELSGGMQKRVALARAIAASPTSLLLDGPTDGLDPIMAAVVDDFVVKTSGELQATTLAITNNLACVRKIASRVAVLQEGEIAWYGEIGQLDASENSYVKRLIKSSEPHEPAR
jgi:phospholipid/cholesterol/gamma-HCH transport system ATP-binding protein